MATQDNYSKYLGTYAGRTLLERHSLDEEGVWNVFGEDPNCDMGGTHHEPHLGRFEGKLEDVIRTAVELPSFWQWGGGGHIRKYKSKEIKKVSQTKSIDLPISLEGPFGKVDVESKEDLLKLIEDFNEELNTKLSEIIDIKNEFNEKIDELYRSLMTGFEKAYEVEKKTEYDRGYKEGWEAASSESPWNLD